MKYEYELHKNIRAKQNSVNWMSSLMLNCIYGIEILNEKYNPFDLKLKNWSEQINADINNYYDVFGEIYEKYNQPGKNMAPELKLVLMISGSALKFHLNKVAISNKPGLPNPTFNGISNGMGQMGQMGQMGMGMGGNMGNGFNGDFSPNSNSNSNGNQDPKIIEQMRQQAALDKMREDHRRQAEALQRKSENEHEIAAKQMQDMMLLQEKQNEFMHQ
jgi:hypothetical protein